jgi:hypothetical protein
MRRRKEPESDLPAPHQARDGIGCGELLNFHRSLRWDLKLEAAGSFYSDSLPPARDGPSCGKMTLSKHEQHPLRDVDNHALIDRSGRHVAIIDRD